MFADERRNRIVDIVNRKASVTTAELTEQFQVSLETVRRDLEFLESQGELRRVHGGAVTVQKMQDYTSLSNRTVTHQTEKRKLALTACSYIQEGDYIALDTGSTTFELAVLIRERFQNLTVLTNSLDIFGILSEKQGIHVILAGGFYLAEEKCFYGYLTMNMIQQFHVSKYFIAPSAISLNFGISDHIQEMVAVQRTFLSIADKTYVLVDSSKFEACAPLKICDLDPRFVCLTDSGLSDEMREIYRNASINIIE